HPSTPPEVSVQPQGDTDQQPLDAAGQVLATASLADEMEVIGLDGELDDAEAGPVRSGQQRATHHAEAVAPAQGGQLEHARGHMNGMTSRKGRTAQVRYPRAGLAGTAGSRSSSAMPVQS